MPRAYRSSRQIRHTSILQRQCRFCFFTGNSKGIASHERACVQKRMDEIRSNALQQINEIEKEMSMMQLKSSGTESSDDFNGGLGYTNDAVDDTQRHEHVSIGEANTTIDSESDDNGADTDNQAQGPSGSTETVINRIPSPDVFSSTQNRSSVYIAKAEEIPDAIKVEYHPNSKRKIEILSFNDYEQHLEDSLPPIDEVPWQPFRTRADFEFGAIALDAGLSTSQSNKLISLINRIARGETQFSLTSHRDLQDCWDQSSVKLQKFEKKVFSVKYKKEQRSFEVHYRPLWPWLLGILQDPRLSRRFQWDARKLYKFNHESKHFVRYFDEPWTGDLLWDIQSKIPEGGTPLGLIFYADKNKLSTFGTQKGYPVVVRCANLPDEVRNGEGIGGGIMVGWLPIVPETAGDSGKTSFANFKNEVWHQAVSIILESIKNISKIGCWVECGDSVQRQVFPFILIASADYEEQTVIALTRGVKSLKPCNTCDIPFYRLSDLSKSYSKRTAKGTKMSYELGRLTRTKKEQEERLKEKGLRPVYNAFWDIGNTDIHRALSFDRLHTLHSGIFAGHIWKVFKKQLAKMGSVGRRLESEIDRGFSLFPIWRELYHFNNVMKITFNDGKKHEDMSKQLLYVAQAVIERNIKSKTYHLLRLFRAYLVLDTYMSFNRHTSETLAEGLKELKIFDLLLKQYIILDDGPEAKNWNFPKLHELLHAFENIMQKGVTRNYNTKPNEKLHGPLRNIYHERTNYKNVAAQITKINHQILVSKYVQAQIDVLDNTNNGGNEIDEEGGEGNSSKSKEEPTLLELPHDDKFNLGAAQKPSTISALEGMYENDIAFKDFRKRLTKFLNNFLLTFDIPLPGNKPLRLNALSTIVEYRYLKVHYLSKVTWQVSTDYLRCTPKFYGKARNDFVIFKTVGGSVFARLLYLFAIWVDKRPYTLALVQALDAYLGPPRIKDQELGITRVGLKPRSKAEFISVNSIERGACLMQEIVSGRENEYLVVDVIDGDMFLRVKEMRKA